jgi:hypothetical protein
MDTRQGTTISRYRSKRQKSRVIPNHGDAAVPQSPPTDDIPKVTSLAINDSARAVNGAQIIATHPRTDQTKTGTIPEQVDVLRRHVSNTYPSKLNIQC